MGRFDAAVTPGDRDDLIDVSRPPRVDLPIWPRHSYLGLGRSTQTEVDRARAARSRVRLRPSAPARDRRRPPGRRSRRRSRRGSVRPGRGRPRANGPSARWPCLARAHVAPQSDVARRITCTRSSMPSRLRSTTAAPRALSKLDDAGRLASFDERAVGLADQQVARVTSGVVRLGVDVALGDEQVDEAVVVDVLELGVPRGRGQRRRRPHTGDVRSRLVRGRCPCSAAGAGPRRASGACCRPGWSGSTRGSRRR